MKSDRPERIFPGREATIAFRHWTGRARLLPSRVFNGYFGSAGASPKIVVFFSADHMTVSRAGRKHEQRTGG